MKDRFDPMHEAPSWLLPVVLLLVVSAGAYLGGAFPVVFAAGDYDLAVNKERVGGGSINSGDTVTFRITAENQGSTDFGTGITIRDYLATGVVFTGNRSVTPGGAVSLTSTTGGVITWTAPFMFPSDSFEIDYTVQIQSAGTLKNHGEIMPGPSDPPEYIPWGGPYSFLSTGINCTPGLNPLMSGVYAVSGTNNIDCEEITVLAPSQDGQCGPTTNYYDLDGDGDALTGGSPGLCDQGSVNRGGYTSGQREWQCVGQGTGLTANCSAIQYYCGDALVQTGGAGSPDEACDDGNQSNGDGCTSVCEREIPMCSMAFSGEVYSGLQATVVISDVDPTREYMSGLDRGDGESETGLTQGVYTYNHAYTPASVYTATLYLENSLTGAIGVSGMCSESTSVGFCGDTVTNGPETCDDGNTDNNDSCTNACQSNVCGDGHPWIPIEECDDANLNENDACKNDCTFNVCGDAVVESGVEACDDGNSSNGDQCSNSCNLTYCGDGITQNPNGTGSGGDTGSGDEACDDGNSINGDGCNNDCTVCTDSDGDGYCDEVDDCDDTDGGINPGAQEVCNGVDDDCDGLVDGDDPSASGVVTWYLDGDSDGRGTGGSTTGACSQPSGYAASAGDCNDSDGAVNPGAQEVCNSIDDDCDMQIDDADPSTTGQPNWYQDNDGDGWGDSLISTGMCSQPGGYVALSGDCDDTTGAVNPGAAEVCDGIDNDCDFLTDDADPSATGQSTRYADSDTDSYGDPGSTTGACSQPSGFVTDQNDCDDTDGGVNPGAQEICNGIDDDCDSLVDGADPSATGLGTWYLDGDSDGRGTGGSTTGACSQPSGYAASTGDCNDSDGAVNPGAQEVCNSIDDDCDMQIDDADPSTTGQPNWYQDNDGDGWGDSLISTGMCSQPGGYVALSGDCDDTTGAVNPGAAEVCDGIDNNCAGGVDEGACGTTTYYCDDDADGAYSMLASGSCSTFECTPVGCIDMMGDDCDDTDPQLYPGQTRYADPDGDGYSDGTTLTQCTQPTDYYLSGSLITTSGDNCPSVANPAQIDGDGDGIGDLCDPAECGNAYLEGTESCDDGNLTGDDGCAASCDFEAPSCQLVVDSMSGSVPDFITLDETYATSRGWIDAVSISWGDGSGGLLPLFPTGHTYTMTSAYYPELIVQNSFSGANQTGSCLLLLEVGVTCGNGIQEPGEYCDDGNLVSGDGCSNICQSEGCTDPAAQNYDASAVIDDGSCVYLFCGDGIVSPQIGERCDDGNTVDGDGCDSSCEREASYYDEMKHGGSSARMSSIAYRRELGCGDGVVSIYEACDDGNNLSNDGCKADCSEFDIDLGETDNLPTGQSNESFTATSQSVQAPTRNNTSQSIFANLGKKYAQQQMDRFSGESFGIQKTQLIDKLAAYERRKRLFDQFEQLHSSAQQADQKQQIHEMLDDLGL